MKHSIKSNYIYNLIYQVVNLTIQVITLPYLTRVIGSNGIGIYSYTTAIVTIFTILGALGINMYGQRAIAQNMKNPEKYSQIFWELILIRILSFCLFIPLYLLTIFLLPKYTIYLLIQGIFYFGTMLDISWLFQGLEDFKIVSLRNTFIKILGIVCIFLFVKSEKDVVLYISIIATSTFLGNVLMWGQLKKNICAPQNHNLKILPHLKMVFYYAIPTLATSVYLLLDKAMIGLITNDDFQNGYYEQATQIINMLKTIFLSYNTIMVSRMTFLFSNKTKKEQEAQLISSCHFIALVSWPLMFGLISIVNEFVNLYYGIGNTEIINLLYIFSPIIIFVSISNLLETHIITPLNLRKKGNTAVIIGAISNFSINLCLIPFWGSKGAGIGSCIAEAIIMIMYIYYSKDLLSIKKLLIVSWKKIVSALTMFLVIQLMGLFIDNYIISIFIKILSGIFLYILMLIILKDEIILNLINKFKKNHES